VGRTQVWPGKALKELEQVNNQLISMIAEQAPDIVMLKKVMT